jgi:glycosyltransferase involved in cell wall biosynthesis
MSDRLRLLLIMMECNPEWPSVPRFAYGIYDALQKLVDVTLVTHIRNRSALARVAETDRIVFIDESRTVQKYFAVVWKLTMRKRTNWSLLHLFGYPVYAEFNARVNRTFASAVRRGEFDAVHAYTPVMPRYPYAIASACERTPFVLGPVNGGLPYPPGFQEIARAELGYLQSLRPLSRLLPGYRQTYKRAQKVLAGSASTYALLKQMFRLDSPQLELFHDTGISADAFAAHTQTASQICRLLFVGRLVPYKGADMLLDALHALEAETPGQFTLTIVGDGQERGALEQRAQVLGIAKRVHFVGWVASEQTISFYQDADIFCFPSIREFGGAVVLEAMAAGLPCIVPDYGGISEFVTRETGIKISVASREGLTRELKEGIRELAQAGICRSQMRQAAIARAREFTWEAKATRLTQLYSELTCASYEK